MNNVVVMEAEHYYTDISTNKTKWTFISDLGRTLSGLSFMPYTENTKDAPVSYKMYLDTNEEYINIRIFFDSTLLFKKGRHSVTASFNRGDEKTWNINEELVWKNCYTNIYPTGAARMNESKVTLELPKSTDGEYDLTIRFLDPEIVLYKIVVNNGGYENTWLKMPESPCKKL